MGLRVRVLRCCGSGRVSSVEPVRIVACTVNGLVEHAASVIHTVLYSNVVGGLSMTTLRSVHKLSLTWTMQSRRWSLVFQRMLHVIVSWISPARQCKSKNLSVSGASAVP